jgi:hypothetical protein
MPLTEILYPARHAEIGVVVCDASVREVHEVAADVSEHKVETGSDITDHFRAEAREVVIEGVITDTPVVPNLGVSQQDLRDARGRVDVAFDGTEWPSVYPSITAFEQLREYVEGNEAAKPEDALVTIVTTLATYTNMKVTRLNVEREASKGNSLHFTLTAKQVRFATTRFAAAPEKPKTPTAAKKRPVGKQPAQPEERASLAYKLREKVRRR